MPDELDPNRFHVMSKKTKIYMYLCILLVTLLVLPLIGYQYYKFAVHRPSSQINELSFDIESGEGLSSVSQRLLDAQAINSKFLFEFYLLINNLDDGMQAGSYVIRAGSSIVDLGELFQHGVSDTRLTFLEGWRLEEFASYASEKLPKISFQQFMVVAEGMEGELFPDTYYVNDEIQEQELVNLLHNTFNTKTEAILSEEALRKSGMTRDQALTLASIVERESNNNADRKIVAGILFKRFKEGIRLDADATVQYAVAQAKACPNTAEICVMESDDISGFDWWPQEITIADLESDSPYNTRKVGGLPPTPISSFSLDTLEAVVNHEESPYYYYLNDSTGRTHFAETLEEHNTNIANYLN